MLGRAICSDGCGLETHPTRGGEDKYRGMIGLLRGSGVRLGRSAHVHRAQYGLATYFREVGERVQPVDVDAKGGQKGVRTHVLILTLSLRL